MDDIRLVSPSMAYEDDLLCFRQELLEAEDADSFAGCGSLRTWTSMEDYLEHLAKWSREDTCPPGSVPSDTYLAVRVSDNRIVGIIDLRHHIDHPILGVWGGHIGYSVRPSERRKGYAKEMLRLNLQNCRALGLTRVMVTCNRENPASEKTILANGGVFEKEVPVDGGWIRRYWITL